MDKRTKGIDDEFQELESMFNELDFSSESSKKDVYDKTLKEIKYKEGKKMIRNKYKKATVAAASIFILCTALIRPTWAEEAVSKILNEISFGHVSYVQVNNPGEEELEDEYKGKVFDKDGNELTSIDMNAVFLDKTEKIYTKDGEEIAYFKDGKIYTVDEANKDIIEITDKDDIKNYVSFEVKFPEYLPDGYEFEKAEYSKNIGCTDGKETVMESIELVFKEKSSDNIIVLGEAFSDQPYALINNDEIETIKINGEDAVIFNGMINWVTNDISYELMSQNFDEDTNIKIAESVK